jgi:hypothetical protein
MGNGKRSRLAEAYEYFHDVIGQWLAIGTNGFDDRCEALVNAIRDKLRIVVIDMDEQDDAQVIFETLNARGTPLLPTDLVKNFLFQRAQESHLDVEELYANYWEEFDVQDHFWREEVGIGRVKRARIDVFLHHYLSLWKREEVPLGELFAEYRLFAQREAARGIEWQLATFRRHAEHFKHFSQTSDESREGKFFDRLSAMQTTTIYPFLLGLYENVVSEPERLAIIVDLESFLVRRMVCRLTTQGYNRLFLELVNDCTKTGAYTADGVRSFLQRQSADSTRWPDDQEFREAWLSQPLYQVITRPRLRLLLTALDAALHGKHTEPYVVKKNLTIEHLLPQHWNRHWPLPVIDGESPEKLAERQQRRDTLLHTIGNLLLLTETLNPLVSNGAFKQKKKAILKHSALNLNRFLSDEEDWDEERIIHRGRFLFKKILKVWQHPTRST